MRPTKGALEPAVKSMGAGDGLCLPAAAQGFVNSHYAAIQLNLGLRLAVFGRQSLALGIEQHQKIHRPFAVANRRQVRCRAAGLALTNQRNQALLTFAVVAEGIL